MALVCGRSLGNQVGEEQTRREDRMNDEIATQLADQHEGTKARRARRSQFS
jgi:hypothetical protein